VGARLSAADARWRCWALHDRLEPPAVAAAVSTTVSTTAAVSTTVSTTAAVAVAAAAW
jgi:hypothetical protein